MAKEKRVDTRLVRRDKRCKAIVSQRHIGQQTGHLPEPRPGQQSGAQQLGHPLAQRVRACINKNGNIGNLDLASSILQKPLGTARTSFTL